MRILHVAHGYPPSIGGTQHLVHRISRQLVSRFGDEVEVFTTVARNMDHFVRDDGQALPAGVSIEEGIRVRRFRVFNRLTRLRMLLASRTYRHRFAGHERFRTWLNGPIVFGMTRAIADTGAEVVMAAAFPMMTMYYALRGARRAGIPIVFCGALHTEDPWSYDREMIYDAIRSADAYIALTAFEKDYLLEKGIAPGKIRVLGGGVDLEAYAKARGEVAREALGLGDAAVVGMISKHVERKRFDVLLAAMEVIWRQEPEVRLLLAGASTPFTAELERSIARLPAPLGKRVVLVRDFDEGFGRDLMACLDVFVLPSARDAFGIVFAEAWACRKPVIGVDVAAIRSLIDPGVDGLLVPYEDPESLAAAILRLLAEPRWREELGRRGYEKVERSYTWEYLGAAYRRLYQDVLGRSRA